MPRGRFSQEQIDEWVHRRFGGESLRSIAADFGVTSQYVSSVTNKQPLPNGATEWPQPEVIDLDAVAIEINEWLQDQTTVTITAVRSRFGLTNHQWNQIWKKLDNKRIVGTLRERSRKATYRDVDIRKAIKRIYRLLDSKPLSSAAYEQHRDADTEPSVPTIHNRYGSWRAACDDARVPCGGTRHQITKASPPASWSIWNDDQILEWVEKFWRELEPAQRPSYNRYDQWQRSQHRAPSGSLVRVRLKHIGNWGDIIAEVSRRANERARAEDPVPA
jgi:hypothetical protein